MAKTSTARSGGSKRRQRTKEQALFPIKLDGKLGYIDADGNLKVSSQFPVESTILGYRFSANRAPVVLEGKWGYIDESGIFVISPQFEEAGPFTEGMAPVKLEGRWGFLDPDGKFVINPQYEEVG